MTSKEHESYSVRLNSLEDRLSAFYSRIIPFIELKDAQPPVTESRFSETGERIGFRVHAGRIEENNRSLEASYLLDIVSLVANLKDHIKNFLSNTGQNPKDFERLIDNNKHLAALIDLNNANKHGTPLRRSRIYANIGLEEIMRGILMISKPGRPTAMQIENGPSVVTAFIKLETERLSFRVSVEKAVEVIEDFLENLFPNQFALVSDRVKFRRGEMAWVEEITKKAKEAQKVLSSKGLWKLVNKQDLKPTMLISFDEKQNPDLPMNMAYVVESPDLDKDTSVKVFDLMIYMHEKYSLDANLYCFHFEQQKDATFVFNYYQSLTRGFNP